MALKKILDTRMGVQCSYHKIVDIADIEILPEGLKAVVTVGSFVNGEVRMRPGTIPVSSLKLGVFFDSATGISVPGIYLRIKELPIFEGCEDV